MQHTIHCRLFSFGGFEDLWRREFESRALILHKKNHGAGGLQFSSMLSNPVRRCDVSNAAIAAILNKMPSHGAPRPVDEATDKIIDARITVQESPLQERLGLIIYAPPGCGKSYCEEYYQLQFIDTDYIFAPELAIVKEMADLGFTIFTNDLGLIDYTVLTVMFIPETANLPGIIAEKTGDPRLVVNNIINDINDFVMKTVK